jgi:hypothetical protein
MVNRLGADGESVMRAGDSPDVGVGDMSVAFLKLAHPDTDVHILQTWDCPTCNARNWAEVVFDQGTIRSIENVALTRASLGRAHFVVYDLYDRYDEITGEPMYVDNALRPDFIKLLAEHLPES